MLDPINSPHARDIRSFLHPYTNLADHEQKGPHIFTRGEGVYVFDEAGKRYIEGLAGLWCASLGFSEKRLVAAATRQLERLPFYHNFAHKAVEPAIDLADILVKRAPGDMAKAFFVNSGSEANDTQVKLVWYYNNILGRPRKKKIVARRGAYHGITVAATSLTGLQYAHNAFDAPLANFLHVGSAHFYHFGAQGESEEQFAERMAKDLDELILREGSDTIAAFIAEPVIGAGGVIPPPPGYFDRIQPILKRHDILFIVDEVITGFFRTGEMFGSQTYSLKPDLISLAKALSAAYQPIGAVLMTSAIHDTLVEGSRQFGLFGHGFTYSGHPVPAAVALEAQKIYEEDQIGEHVKAITPHFQRRLRALSAHLLVGEARGVGLIGAIELVRNKSMRENFEPTLKVGAWVANRALEHGLIVRPLVNDTIAFCPPLIIVPSQIDDMFDAMEHTLDDAAKHVESL